jgi:hypothetical protein
LPPKVCGESLDPNLFARRRVVTASVFQCIV